MSRQALLDAFGPGSIAVGVSATTREDAILAAAALLQASGRTTADYGQQMVDAMHEFGPYFVLAPGIAMAHAKPSAAVLSAGLALAVLSDAIEFGNQANDPVRLVFALCAVDHDSHMEVLAQLAELLTDLDQVNFMLNASTAEQIRLSLSQTLEQ